MTGLGEGTLSSSRRDWSHIISAVIFARLLYSTSVLDLAIRGYFLDHQEPRFGPRKAHAPEVDLLSSISDVQSASQDPRSPRGWTGLSECKP